MNLTRSASTKSGNIPMEVPLTGTLTMGNMASNIGENLFHDSITNNDSTDCNQADEESWNLPKLKTPDKGDPISNSLATLINTACTKQCQLDDILDKYKVPANCEFMGAPCINKEIWRDLSKFKRVQTTDKSLRDIQNSVCSGMLPILSLAKNAEIANF